MSCCCTGAGLSDYKPARWCGPTSCCSTGADLSEYKPVWAYVSFVCVCVHAGGQAGARVPHIHEVG